MTIPTVAAHSINKSDFHFFGAIFAAPTPTVQRSSSTACNIVKVSIHTLNIYTFAILYLFQSWNIEQLFHDTKFLQSEALLELIKVCYTGLCD